MRLVRVLLAAGLVIPAVAILLPWSSAVRAQVYATYGVHNSDHGDVCANPDCRYVRGPSEPVDPIYPPYWSSNWTMYRVFNNYAKNPPPYHGLPPATLRPGVDYEVSYGASYYDSTWLGPTGVGAMMERYDKRCLPIFPISNHFSCAFISLGEVAYFVTYPQDRPAEMPPVCLFSPKNHPPPRDVVSHLPYSRGDSKRLGPFAQGYSFWISATDGKPVQTGASPDHTANAAILFGYAFDRTATGAMRPQSFYFSGFPLAPANAPIVSQNYTDFKVARPDPAKTWNQIKNLDPTKLPKCRLFDPPSSSKALSATARTAPTWGDIGRWHGQ